MSLPTSQLKSNLKDGGDIFRRNISNRLQDYTVLQAEDRSQHLNRSQNLISETPTKLFMSCL